ncbi:MAG: sigma 54-interacting transcriptional regulator [Firmicutes bacterium]|nr:sigma 54-interacting transcriptional regulator [Bacillota bacterium]
MYREDAESIFTTGNFFDELCIIDQGGVIRFYEACPINGAPVSVDEAIGKHILEVFSALEPGTNEVLQALEERKAICTFHDYCLNYRDEAWPGYISTFPIMRKKEFVGIAIALKYLTPDYSKEYIQIQDNSFRRKRFDTGYTIDDIITRDPYMNQLKEKIRKVSRRDSTVLIQGSTGTGKELVAQSIHYLSPRSTGPFLSQNCSAIPDNLLESTLFGTEKGSFTGAVTNQGLLELANGGTLFLDEINSMDMALQSKILTAIESRTVRRLGGHEDIRINIRIIAAVNEDPFEAIKNHHLRSDLFYRLNVVNFHLTDLKDRPTDILYLTDYYINYYNQLFDMDIKGISEDAADLFTSHTWPGNVRELRNIIEGAFNVAETDLITVSDLPEYLKSARKPQFETEDLLKPQSYASFHARMEELEQAFLLRTIDSCRSKAAAAELLDITPQALNYKLHRNPKDSTADRTEGFK